MYEVIGEEVGIRRSHFAKLLKPFKGATMESFVLRLLLHLFEHLQKICQIAFPNRLKTTRLANTLQNLMHLIPSIE